MKHVFGPRRAIAVSPLLKDSSSGVPVLTPPARVFWHESPLPFFGAGRFSSRVCRIIPPGPTARPYPFAIKAQAEPPPPFSGAALACRGFRATTSTVQHATPVLFARAEAAPPWPGRVVTLIGHVLAVNTTVAGVKIVAAQQSPAEPPLAGRFFGLRGGVDSGSTVPKATAAVSASPPAPPPFAGAAIRRIGGVPATDTTPVAPKPVLARMDVWQPEPGKVLAAHGVAVWWPMPVIPRVFAQEPPRPAAGAAISRHAVPATAAQVPPPPGRAARQEEPPPYSGFAVVRSRAGRWQFQFTIIGTTTANSFVAPVH